MIKLGIRHPRKKERKNHQSPSHSAFIKNFKKKNSYFRFLKSREGLVIVATVWRPQLLNKQRA